MTVAEGGPKRVLVVDDVADNREVLRARLASHGYAVTLAVDGDDALRLIAENPPDLVLLDVMMPKLDGIATVRRLKADPTLPFIPVILLTAKSANEDVVAGLEAGADEYLSRPIDHAALVARVQAMLRIKALQDEVARQAALLREQAAALAEWNTALEGRVARQVDELERMARLKAFLPPQVAEAILSSPSGERVLESHRAEISVLFCDLRGFSAFAETSEPEDVMALLREYHEVVGESAFARDGTLERFAGDGIMILFNDPLPCPDHCRRSAALAVALREDLGKQLARWNLRGAELGVGFGLATGHATLGRIGFHRRFDYAAIGTVTNLASRLCGRAAAGQILASARLASAVDGALPTCLLGHETLKGFSKPVGVYEIAPPSKR